MQKKYEIETCWNKILCDTRVIVAVERSLFSCTRISPNCPVSNKCCAHIYSFLLSHIRCSLTELAQTEWRLSRLKTCLKSTTGPCCMSQLSGILWHMAHLAQLSIFVPELANNTFSIMEPEMPSSSDSAQICLLALCWLELTFYSSHFALCGVKLTLTA